MDRVGAPAFAWLLCLQYVCFLLNNTYNDSVDGVPIQHLTGYTNDISPLLRFHFWQKVYYLREGHSFPSESTEGTGYIVGILEHVGPIMTYNILTEDTLKVIYRSSIRPHSDDDPNLRGAAIDGEEFLEGPCFIKSRSDLQKGGESLDGNDTPVTPPFNDPLVEIDDLIGRSFLLEPKEDGSRN